MKTSEEGILTLAISDVISIQFGKIEVYKKVLDSELFRDSLP
jgi:hypothetical protein